MFVVFLAASLAFFLGCTKNPFGDDEVSLGARQLRGTVVLDDGKSAEGAYVWLESFNLGTYTDKDGKFEITLPLPSNQGISGDRAGIYTLYSYIANYHLASTQVRTLNGEFLLGQHNISDKGELHEPLRMKNFLRIATEVRRAPAPLAALDTMRVQVMLRLPFQYLGGAVTAYLLKRCEHESCPPDTFGAILASKTGSGEIYMIQNPGATSRDLLIVENSPIVRSMTFLPAKIGLPPGEYEAVPYLWLEHGATVPQGIYDSIGKSALGFGSDYLKIPFKREGGRFVVR